MSNYNNFKTAMEKLGNKVNFTTTELNDSGKNSSSFYTKLIDLFDNLPNQPETKGCKFTFNKGIEENKNFYIYLTPDTITCVKNIQNTQTFKNSKLTFYADKNAIGMKGSQTENKDGTINDDETKRQEYLAAFYGDAPGVKQLTTEELLEDINRIKNLING